MIPVIIFYMHIVGLAFAFSYSFHKHKLADGFLAVAFVAIIFSVGWTIAGFLVKFAIPEKGIGPIDSDSISLLIVTILEAVLYLVYFRGKSNPTVAG